jgi:CBS domain-containing protein
VGKSVKDAMTRTVKSVQPSQTVVEAAALMKKEDVGSLPVVENGGRLVGMVTDRDIVVRGIAGGADIHSLRVDAIASRDCVTVRPDDDLDEALSLMGRHRVRRLPVVDEGRLAGIIAQADLAGQAKSAEMGAALEEISKPASAA